MESRCSQIVNNDPDTLFWILAVLFLSYGLYQLYKAFAANDPKSSFGGVWLTFFVLPILYLIARAASRNLRTNFEKYMNIEPVDEDRPR